MMGDRAQVAIWVSAFLSIIAVIFMVTGCVQNQTKQDTSIKQACIAKNGDWELLSTGGTFGCKFK